MCIDDSTGYQCGKNDTYYKFSPDYGTTIVTEVTYDKKNVKLKNK